MSSEDDRCSGPDFADSSHSPHAAPGSPAEPRAFPTAVDAIFKAGLGGSFTLPVRVIGMSKPMVYMDRPAVVLTLRDLRSGDDHTTRPITDFTVVKRARRAFERGEILQLTGCFVYDAPRRRRRKADEDQDDEPVSAKKVFVEVEYLTPLPRPSAILGAPQEVLDQADAFIDEHAGKDGALFRALLERVHTYYHVVTQGRSKRFQLCEKAVFLQALSHGSVNRAVNGRLSMLITSRPGSSKKLMALAALVLAPLGQIVQPALVTSAGLAARVGQTESGWKAEPGALPACSYGVVVLEDMHRVPPNKLPGLQGCLTAVAEDGKVIPVKAATATYQAETALHINANLTSILGTNLRGTTARDKMKDLGLPYDLLSRMDIIMHLDVGDNASKQARHIATQDLNAAWELDEEDQDEDLDELALSKKEGEALFLKAVIARLLDRYGAVDIKPAQKEIGRLMDDISLLIGDYSARMSEEEQLAFDGEALLRRMANSVRKLVAASARLDGRAVVSSQDVETAWEMLGFKLEVVRWICDSEAARVRTLGSREAAVQAARQAADERWEQLMDSWAGQEIVVVEAAAALGVSDRTVGRDLVAHGVLPELGVARLPTHKEWAETAAALRRGAELPEPERVITDEDYQAPEAGPAQPTDRPADAELKPVPKEIQPLVDTIDQRMPEDEARDVRRALLEASVEYDGHPYETPFRLQWLKHAMEKWMGPGAPYEWLKGLDDAFEVLQGDDALLRAELALRIFVDSTALDHGTEKIEVALQRGELPPDILRVAAAAQRIIDWRYEQGARKLAARRAWEEEMRRREERVSDTYA